MWMQLCLLYLGSLGGILDDVALFQHLGADAVGLGEVLGLLGGVQMTRDQIEKSKKSHWSEKLIL